MQEYLVEFLAAYFIVNQFKIFSKVLFKSHIEVSNSEEKKKPIVNNGGTVKLAWLQNEIWLAEWPE